MSPGIYDSTAVEISLPLTMIEIPYGPVKRNKLELIQNRVIKRSVDILLGGTLALLILPWFIPLMAIVIKLDSKGPVFFIQKRTGKDLKTFNCIKLRSMRVNKDADRLQVQPGDKRITATGHFLRSYYLDEVPQLINVLWGDMSLVGPRPHMLRHNVVYARIIKNYHDRHLVKPGLSGLAQFRGFHGMIRNKKDLVNRVSSDIEYIETWTLFSDLVIFLSTILHIFKSPE